jgi:ABC-type lipoprotein release transport system permease subunit
MILLEAVMLTLMAAAIGAAIGFGIAAAVNAAGIEVTSKGIQTFLMTDELLLDLNVGSLIDAIVIITTFNGLGALYPAWQAAKIPPVVAMQKG